MSLRNLSIIAGIIALLVIGKILSTGKDSATVQGPAGDSPKSEIARKAAPTELAEIRGPKNRERIDAMKSVELEKTANCESEEARKAPLRIGNNTFIRLMRGFKPVQLAGMRSPCLVKNKVYPILVTWSNAAGNLIYHQEQMGEARVTEIRQIPLPILARELKGKVPDATIKRLALSLQRINKNRIRNGENRIPSATFYTLSVEDKTITKESYGAPREHPLAKTVSATRGQDLSKYFIIDVRPEAMFRVGALPGAINIEPSNYFGIAGSVLSVRAIRKRGVLIAPDKIPQNRPVLVYGNGISDMAPYNVISLLALQNVKDLHWLRGGYDEWIGYKSNFQLPSFVTAVNASQTARLLADGAIAIDVRPPGQFNENHLRGAVNYPIEQGLDDRQMPAYRDADMTAQGLANRNESFRTAPAVARDKAVVVIARNEFDIRNLKAALLLRSLGFSKIYLLRGGMAEWRHHATVFPNNFPTSRSIAGDETD
jgi:rhodanese-related sulfurtransferase